MFVTTSAIAAQNQRVLLLSQNIANANIKTTPGAPIYERQLAVFESAWNPQVKTNLLRVKKIMKDKSPPIKTYAPGDPMADAAGYVQQPDISPIMEMTDMRQAGRSHEAALRAFEKVLSMLQNTLSVLKS
jgi:flagellar basal-body rod protein FlgC